MSEFEMVATIVTLAAATVGHAAGQDVLLDIKGPVPFGNAAHGIGVADWDGDGIDDLAVGAPLDGTAGISAGAVRVYSARTGTLVTAMYGASPGDEFGANLMRIPDVDGDGIDDIAIAAPGASNAGAFSGSVYVYAAGTGALLYRIDGPAIYKYAGNPLGAIGDVDGDGICDLFIGHSFGFDDQLDICSGADGHLINTLIGKSGEYFGTDASELDDLDGDGLHELLVGAPLHVNSKGDMVGAAYVVEPTSGTVLLTLAGTKSFEGFGFAVASLGDLDNDGVRDFAVSGLDPKNPIPGFAIVHIVSSATGTELARIRAPESGLVLSGRTSNVGDVNGDAIEDIGINGTWVDAAGSGHAAVYLVSGRTLIHLDRVEIAEDFAWSQPFGDLNGDGVADFIVNFVSGNQSDGEVRIYSGDDLWLNGTPSEPTSGSTLELTTREGVPGALTILVLEDFDGVPTFQIINGVATFGSFGGRKIAATVPSGLAGHQCTFRSYANDAAGHVIASAPQTIDLQ